MSILNIISHVLTTFFFVVYWTQVWSWYDDGVEWYGIIGSGVAANGGFIGNIAHSIIEANDAYKASHKGEDMPLVKNLKKIFLFWKN
jgi:hypothetical protein